LLLLHVNALQIIALLTTTYVREKYKGKDILGFRGNSVYAKAPQCRYKHFAYLAYPVSITEFILSQVATLKFLC